MTPLETSLISFSVGIFGWIARSIFAGKAYVKTDICKLVHKNLDQTLERIEKKIDKINGGSN